MTHSHQNKPSLLCFINGSQLAVTALLLERERERERERENKHYSQLANNCDFSKQNFAQSTNSLGSFVFCYSSNTLHLIYTPLHESNDSCCGVFCSIYSQMGGVRVRAYSFTHQMGDEYDQMPNSLLLMPNKRYRMPSATVQIRNVDHQMLSVVNQIKNNNSQMTSGK